MPRSTVERVTALEVDVVELRVQHAITRTRQEQLTWMQRWLFAAVTGAGVVLLVWLTHFSLNRLMEPNAPSSSTRETATGSGGP